MSIKVLVLLNNIPLYGSERGNINVFFTLKDHVDSLFVTHAEYGDLYINPHLEKLGLKHQPANYIGKICRREKISEYFVEIKNSLKGNYQLFKIMKKYKPDYIHIPTEASFISMMMTLWLTRIPVIYRLGDSPRQNRKVFSTIWKKLIIPRVHKFVCISHFIKRKLLELGVPGSKIKVIYNSPPQRLNNNSGKRLNGEIRRNFEISYMGQISKDKGVDLLVNAAIEICRRYNNINFNIAGDYSWQNPFAEQLIVKVNEEKLNHRIWFLGMIEDVPGLLKTTDLHVCPSVWDEPLSNVTVEAKEAGVPSIIFPSGGLPELIEHKVDGFICKEKSAEALIEAIEFYYNNTDFLKANSKAALESMNKLGIDREAYIKNWLSVYERL